MRSPPTTAPGDASAPAVAWLWAAPPWVPAQRWNGGASALVAHRLHGRGSPGLLSSSANPERRYITKKSSHRPLDLAVYLLYKFSCFGERVFLLCFHLFFGVEVGCREDMSHLRGTVKTARRLRQNSPMDRLAVIRTYTSVWIACVFWYGSAAVWIGPGYGSGCAFLVPDLPGGPASMRGQRALPDLKCELRISVGTPQPRNRMSE